MDSLRLILLLIGVVFIVGIYLVYKSKQDTKTLKDSPFSKFINSFSQRFSAHKDSVDNRYELNNETLDDEDIEQLSSVRVVSQDEHELGTESFSAVPELETEVAHGDELVIVFNIMATANNKFKGLDILDALLANGFTHGDMKIFHYFETETDKLPVCSIANAVEPGFFELEHIEAIETPGLSLFMQLPGSQEARASFDIMLSRGRAVAEHLQGELCDETRSVLTMQTIGHIKEKIEAWLFKQKMARVRQHSQN